MGKKVEHGKSRKGKLDEKGASDCERNERDVLGEGKRRDISQGKG